jgi:hypothetical protein
VIRIMTNISERNRKKTAPKPAEAPALYDAPTEAATVNLSVSIAAIDKKCNNKKRNNKAKRIISIRFPALLFSTLSYFSASLFTFF